MKKSYTIEIDINSDIEKTFDAVKAQAIKDFESAKKLQEDLEKVFKKHKVENQAEALASLGIIQEPTQKPQKPTKKKSRSRLTSDIFNEIKNLSKDGLNDNQISKQLGIGYPTVRKVSKHDGDFDTFYKN